LACSAAIVLAFFFFPYMLNCQELFEKVNKYLLSNIFWFYFTIISKSNILGM